MILVKITNRKAGEKLGSNHKILSMVISQTYGFSDEQISIQMNGYRK